MGIVDERPFDFNHDGEENPIETMVGLQMFADSRQEALDLTGDDTFYIGDDPDDEFDEDEDNGFHDEFDDIDDYDDADEYDDEDPDDCDDWD